MTNPLTFSTAKTQFVNDLKTKGRSTATILAYSKDIDQLIDFVQKNKVTSLETIAADHIEAFKKSLLSSNYTAKSISRKLNSIKTFCRFLISLGIIKNNPAATITHPKYDIKAPRILTKMEYRSLRDVCREDLRVYAIVEILLQTGIRIGELANLSLDDIDSDKLNIKAFESHCQRQVPLNKAAAAALAEYLKIRPKTKSKNAFITKTGKPFLIRNIRTSLDRFFKQADIKNARVNDLRHTFIAHQLQAGTPLTLISKLVGHKRLSTTEKYLELIKGKDAAIVSLEEL